MRRELPSRDDWAIPWSEPPRPSAYPPNLSDRKEEPVTVLYGPNGEPLLIRKPIPFGFRPDRAK